MAKPRKTSVPPHPAAAKAGLSLIFDERFPIGTLPKGWYTDTAFPVYEPGAWDCRRGDGVFAPLPHDAWRHLRVEIELDQLGSAATAFCGTDCRTALSLALGRQPGGRHQASDGGYVILQSATPAPQADGILRLVFEWAADAMRANANGTLLLEVPNLRGSARCGALQLGFRDCRVTRVAALGESLADLPASPRALAPGYPLEVTVDFNDDLMACAWTPQTFDALFAELRSWGARRISWIDIGREKDGFFDFAPLGIAEHARETFRQAGDIFTAAVRHAHAHGLELVGILKPYDMAIHITSFPPGSPEARQHGRINRIGGVSTWATHLAADNQHLIMARKPSAYGPAKNAVWTRLDLVKDDEAPAAISPGDVTILVSEDNDVFRPYEGPVVRRELVEDYPVYRCTPSGPIPTGQTRRSRVFRFENLDLRAPFIALEVKGGARSFVNRLCDLVHVFGEQGEESHLTYGLSPRRASPVARSLLPPGAAPAETTGPQGGFEYNRYPGSPSSLQTSGGDPITAPLALDRGAVSWLALARGKDRGPLAALSPSFPETRALWMTWVTAMLDAGADGVDIRFGHHHGDFAWGEYGFEAPVRDEMLRRTGVDIWETDEFDQDLWRRIRGEGWTQFIREASAMVRGRGRKLMVHLDSTFDGAPGRGGGMNIVCDWRTWLEEGLVDGVTGKSLWPGTSLAREVLALAHARGVPVSYAPYGNNFFEKPAGLNHVGDSPVGCEIPVERLIQWGRTGGFDSFVFYECASALRAAPDGTVAFRQGAEPLREVMRRHFRAGAEA
jgi:hypothetical protein